ncbi:hypothetical protein [Acinetobacter piscicola]|uniref:hypothetical protein n=1 Tax=Acinetobacter piscicola TaxID=2006115 RepID=UPI000B7D55FA
MLKAVRLESLLDRPDAFAATYAIAEKYSVSPNNSRAVSFYFRHGFIFIPEWESVALSSGEKNQKMECSALF